MKKKLHAKFIFYLLLSILLATPTHKAQAAQDSVPYSFVLVEEFGGTWCTSCPALADSLASISKQIDNMAVISYHIGETKPEVSFLYNYDAYGRSGYYDTVRSLPSAFVNGKKVDNINKIRKAIEDAGNKKTPYELQLEVAHFPDRLLSRDSFSIKVHIQRVAQDIDRRIRLQLAFTQDHLDYKWFNQNEVNHALTFMYPHQEGTLVTLDETGSADLSFRFGADYAKSRFPIKNGSVIAFIQDETVRGYDTLSPSGTIRPKKDNTVLQAVSVYLGDGGHTVPKDGESTGADFHNRTPEIANYQLAHYYDNTLSGAEAYHWEFEGGEPAFSEDLNPKVRYPQPGKFSTSLTITRHGVSNTIRKENVISVLDVKPRFTVKPATAKPNSPIEIALLSEADSCRWMFFGGDPLLVEGKEASVTYSYEGLYDVKVAVFYKSPVTNTLYSFDSTAFKIIHISQEAASDQNPRQATVQVKRIPGSQSFHIANTDGQLEYADIFSVEGKRILRTKHTEFNLSAFPEGIYIVSVKLAGSHPVSFKLSK